MSRSKKDLSNLIHSIFLLREITNEVPPIIVSTSSHVAETMFTGMPGGPKFNIPKEQLEFLIEQHFSTPAVADILGVSRRTVVWRLREFGLRGGPFDF